MSTSLIFLVILIVGLAAFFAGRGRAMASSKGKLSALHSLPGYHGVYVAIWAVLPAAFVLAVWLLASPFFIENSVRSALPDTVKSQGTATTELMLGQVMQVANGLKRLSSHELAAVTSGS